MTEEIGERDIVTDIAALMELLPNEAQFILGAANSTSKKLKQVVRATLAAPVNLREPAGTYEFDNPIFLRQLQIHGPDIAAIKAVFTLTSVGVDGARIEHRLSELGKGTNNHLAYVIVNRIVKAVEVNIAGKHRIAVTRISFTGYRLDEIEMLSERMRQSLDLRRDMDSFTKDQVANVKKFQDQKAEIKSEIATVAETKAELEKAVSGLEESKSQAESQLAAVRSLQAQEQKALVGLETKVTAAQNNESQLKTDVRSLNEKIGELKRELKELENDRSVISDEYRDYVKEGQSQATLYTWIAGACLLFALVGAGLLVFGAAHYLDPRVTSTSEAYALFVQRLPFTIAFAATIGLLLKLADYLIKGVYSIHQSRLTLARLLVLAKDTVYSSAADLDVSDAERLKERVRLKVDLLRQYLSAELGATIRPSAPTANGEVEKGEEDTFG